MRNVGLTALLLCTACVHGWSPFRNKTDVQAEAATDSIYWRAVAHLSPNNKAGSRDSAVALLDTYLKSATPKKHVTEASTLLALAHDAQQLAKVQAALQQAKADARESADRPRSDSSPTPARDESAVKEIERLKAELARANDELERIKKRLATPPAKP